MDYRIIDESLENSNNLNFRDIFFSREVNANPQRLKTSQEDRATDSPVAIIKFSNSYHTSFFWLRIGTLAFLTNKSCMFMHIILKNKFGHLNLFLLG